MLFRDLIEINPKVTLEKGKEYPFVEMGTVSPSRRYVVADQVRVYKGGGAKFKSGDTLFARITPCLENGKIAQYIGFDNDFGFGSTEFFVFRAKEKISYPAFIYYLCLTDEIRGPAEKSMFGASGRQRADLDVVKNVVVPDLGLEEQIKIASILSAYDDLIENNLRRVKILEEMAQLIFREWFVKFRFPGHEKVKMVDSPLGKIPEGWKARTFGDLFQIRYGKTLPIKHISSDGDYPVYGAGDIIGYYNTYVAPEKVTLVTCRGNGSGTVWRTRSRAFVTNNSLMIYPLEQRGYLKYHFIYLLLKHSNVRSAISGSAQPQITIDSLNSVCAICPPKEVVDQFSELTFSLFELEDILTTQDSFLRQTRDLLLPRLISGQLDVSELDIEIGEPAA